MDKELFELFGELSPEEAKRLIAQVPDLTADIDRRTKSKTAKMIRKKTGVKTVYKQTKKNTKAFKIILAAAAAAIVFAFSAFALNGFKLPEGFIEQQKNANGLTFDSITPLGDSSSDKQEHSEVNNNSVISNGYIITFEAVATGSKITRKFDDPMSVFGRSPEEIEQLPHTVQITDDKCYALFTLKKEDGTPITEEEFDATDLYYCIILKGYAPYWASFQNYFPASYVEDGTAYLIYEVTDAQIFADKELYIAIHECETNAEDLGLPKDCSAQGIVNGKFQLGIADWNILRMDKNGEPYFTEKYSGIKALFRLELDSSLADSEKASEYMKTYIFISAPDYSYYDDPRYLGCDEPLYAEYITP